MTYPNSTAHLYVIEGFGRPHRVRRTAKRWFPLYHYRNSNMARAIVAHLKGMDTLPKELTEFDMTDFRVVAPEPAAEFDFYRKQAAKRRRRTGETVPPPLPSLALTRPLKRTTEAPLRVSDRAIACGPAAIQGSP